MIHLPPPANSNLAPPVDRPPYGAMFRRLRREYLERDEAMPRSSSVTYLGARAGVHAPSAAAQESRSR